MGIGSGREGTEETYDRNSGGRETQIRLPVEIGSGREGTARATSRDR